MTRDPLAFIKPEIIQQFIAGCKAKGHDVIVTSTARTWQEQVALFAQGREPLAAVNRLRRLAGLSALNQIQNRNAVTWTLQSAHLVNLEDERRDNDLSLAFDFAITYNGTASWDVKADVDKDKIPDYLECAEVGESLGLSSGRHFKNADYCHLEWRQS